ncbi:MAG: PilZ domain-containing protein [Phycisphaerales bacterium JB063]
MSSIDQRDWKQFLAHLVKRDGCVELAPRGASTAETRKVYKSRLFAVQPDGTLIVERPDQSVLDHAFSIGDTIELLLVVNNQRMLGDCELLGVETRQINPKTRITCLKLAAARRIRADQRRTFFRVNTAGADLGAVGLLAHGADPEDEIEARLVNLGGGGMGVCLRAHRDVLRRVQSSTRYRCRLEVRSEDAVVDLEAKLVHLSPLDTTGLYLGLEFDLPEGQAGKAMQARLTQYGTWLQRQQLKRRRA